MSDPKTFDELDKMCIHVQNVRFRETDRKSVPVNKNKPYVNNIQDERKCFQCNRVGHIAKNCYRAQRGNTFNRNYEQKNGTGRGRGTTPPSPGPK
jgi:hypothetical protein